MTSRRIQTGDVMAYSRFSHQDYDPPVWVVAVTSDRCRIACNPPKHMPVGYEYTSATGVSYKGEGAIKWLVEDPNEWPDEVCTLVAQLMLTGDVS